MNIEALEEKQEAHRIKVAKLYAKAKMIRLEKCELGMETCRLALWRHGKRPAGGDKRRPRSQGAQLRLDRREA